MSVSRISTCFGVGVRRDDSVRDKGAYRHRHRAQ
jgi:hypothetical protein